MSDDDKYELEACWADVRRPRPPPPPPPIRTAAQQWRDLAFTSPERYENSLGALQRLLSESQELDVTVGLFTADGEVTGAGYSRVRARLQVGNGEAHMTRVTFPQPLGNWGTVYTTGIFSLSGEAIFYVDLQNPLHVSNNDTVHLNAVTARLD